MQNSTIPHLRILNARAIDSAIGEFARIELTAHDVAVLELDAGKVAVFKAGAVVGG